MTDASPRAAAVASEQAHLDRVLARVATLRTQAERRLADVSGRRLGSTFAAQFERDVVAHHQAGRVARFTVGDREALLFGRLDLDDGDTLPIGRVSVIDEDDVLLVDWRAPAAAPFYRATAAHPLGVARRRTILADGPRVLDVMDELVDAEAADRLGLEATTGQGALLAALERTHTEGMRDIVATIQADQDRIIRAPATGTLIVTGGPGTGKTVVALHRVAYLLYEDRERYENRGVLVVGPSRTFTEYTRRVLPSLGEDRVVQRPMEALGPVDVDVTGWDAPAVADVKGDPRMVAVCARLLEASLPPLPERLRFTVLGTTAEVGRRTLSGIRRRGLARIDPARPVTRYHARTASVLDHLVGELRAAWDRRRSEHPSAAADPGEEQFRELALESPEVRMALQSFWPERSALDVLAPFARGERSLSGPAGDLLSTSEIELLHAAWLTADGWSVEDVALLDEIDHLLGDPAPPERREEDGPTPPDVEDRWYADFGHVVVDEAQDLSPMQWRAVVRRGPYASWTVVGDLAQRARDTPPASWPDIAELIGRRQVTVEHLGRNYRTPAELAPLARRALALAGHDPDAFPETVRTTGRPPHLVVDDDPCGAGLWRALADVAAIDEPAGTIGVVVPTALLDRVREELRDRRPSDVDTRVLDPRRAKGLEFDDLIVAAPEDILEGSPLGAHELYVALTRATRSLRVVTAAPDLPVLSGATWADPRV